MVEEKKKNILGYKIKRFFDSKLVGLCLSFIQFVVTIVLLGELLHFNILPVKYFLVVSFVFLLLSMCTFVLQYSKKFRCFGKVITVLFICVWSVGIYYLGTAKGMFETIAGADTKTDVIQLYTMKASRIDSLEEINDEKIGILMTLDRDNTNKMLKDIENKVGHEINIIEYTGWQDLVDALYAGEVQAIVLNKTMVSVIIEHEGYENFKGLIKIVYYKNIETQISVNTKKDITNVPFVVYISGIDERGNISNNSRSDVNILAVINPNTRQVLLLNTPRDYYVKLAMDGEPLDKLTHAGIYGVDMSMNTLGKLYGIDIDYFLRINFTGFEQVVDELGGVNVYSEYEFTSTEGYHFYKGNNFLDGESALAFARERRAFSTGDNQRGKNQMALIKAIIEEMISPSVLNDFGGLMESIEESVQVSLSSSQISSLVRMQLNEGGGWNVVSYAVTGNGDTQYCYSLGKSAYVMLQNQNSINDAKQLIQMVIDGKKINLDEVQ